MKTPKYAKCIDYLMKIADGEDVIIECQSQAAAKMHFHKMRDLIRAWFNLSFLAHQKDLDDWCFAGGHEYGVNMYGEYSEVKEKFIYINSKINVSKAYPSGVDKDDFKWYVKSCKDDGEEPISDKPFYMYSFMPNGNKFMVKYDDYVKTSKRQAESELHELVSNVIVKAGTRYTMPSGIKYFPREYNKSNEAFMRNQAERLKTWLESDVEYPQPSEKQVYWISKKTGWPQEDVMLLNKWQATELLGYLFGENYDDACGYEVSTLDFYKNVIESKKH